MKTYVGIRLIVSGISTMDVSWVNLIRIGATVSLKKRFLLFTLNPLISWTQEMDANIAMNQYILQFIEHNQT